MAQVFCRKFMSSSLEFHGFDPLRLLLSQTNRYWRIQKPGFLMGQGMEMEVLDQLDRYDVDNDMVCESPSLDGGRQQTWRILS